MRKNKMSDLFNFTPKGNKKEESPKPINFNEIPDVMKKYIRCPDCNHSLFKERFKLCKITDNQGKIIYMRINVLICGYCDREMEDKP